MTGRWRARSTERSATSVRSAATCHDPVEQDVLRVLKIARSIADPFEQAMFLMVQILHVAPFAEMNDRVALHAANIPLLRAGLAPLSFVDWPRDLYASGVRGVVERNRVDLLRDLFVWGYQRSAQRLGSGAAAHSVPDPFRIAYDAELRAAVSEAIRQRVPQRELPAWLEFRIAGGLTTDLRPRFVDVVTAELDGLHEGNFARYDVTVDEFRTWRAGWLRDCTDIQRLV
jgi:prophage maintenance system killer protein